jgi:hypothetical protein
MKKHLLLISGVILSAAAMAQVQPKFGIRGGLSSAGIKGDAVTSLNSLLDYAGGAITTSNRTGFFAGGYVNLPVGGAFSVEPAIYYSQKGYQLNGGLSIKGVEFLSPTATAKLNAQYIDVPVLLKGNFGGFQVFAGPQVSYLANADLSMKAGILGFNVFNKSIDATNQFNRWDAGLTAGVGFTFGNGVNVSAAYDHGLMKTDANKNFEAYNRSFKVGLGFQF